MLYAVETNLLSNEAAGHLVLVHYKKEDTYKTGIILNTSLRSTSLWSQYRHPQRLLRSPPMIPQDRRQPREPQLS